MSNLGISSEGMRQKVARPHKCVEKEKLLYLSMVFERLAAWCSFQPFGNSLPTLPESLPSPFSPTHSYSPWKPSFHPPLETPSFLFHLLPPPAGKILLSPRTVFSPRSTFLPSSLTPQPIAQQVPRGQGPSPRTLMECCSIKNHPVCLWTQRWVDGESGHMGSRGICDTERPRKCVCLFIWTLASGEF